MRQALIIGLMAATGIAATSIANETNKRNEIDVLKSPPVYYIDGCQSEYEIHPEQKETIVYKRERACQGETKNIHEGKKK